MTTPAGTLAGWIWGLAAWTGLSAEGSARAPAQFELQAPGGRDVSQEGMAFVEVGSPRNLAFVGEPIPLTLTFGFERAFLSESLIPLFGAPLDVSVQVQSPGWTDATFLRPLAPRGDAAATLGSPKRFVLNDGVGEAREVGPRIRQGREFVCFETTAWFSGDGAGPHRLPGPLLRFAYASRFDVGPFGERRPADHLEAHVRGADFVLTLEDLPELGRPETFSGAIGALRLNATLSEREVDAGGTLTLTWIVEGVGNLESFATPRLGEIDGWRVLGAAEERGPKRRRIDFALSPTDPRVSRLPELTLPTFDPTPPGAWRTLRSPAFDVSVRAAQVAGPIEEQSPATGQRDRVWIQVVAGVGVAATLVTVLLRRRRAAGPAAVDTRPRIDPARVAAARTALRTAAAASHGVTLPILAEYLGAETAAPAGSVLDPGLAQRLERAGMERSLAERTEHCIVEMVAARYGGAPAKPPPALDGLVTELEAAFSRPAR